MSVGIATLTLLRSSYAFHPTLDSRFGLFGIAGGPRRVFEIGVTAVCNSIKSHSPSNLMLFQ